MNFIEIINLLNFDDDISLVYCVSQDLNMGAGISVELKKRYGNKYNDPQVGNLVINKFPIINIYLI